MSELEQEMLLVLKLQHEAIDRLFAQLVLTSSEKNQFYPSKSGQPWVACQVGAALIRRLEPYTDEG